MVSTYLYFCRCDGEINMNQGSYRQGYQDETTENELSQLGMRRYRAYHQ
jgi:hypothetical protein